ncbi:MAG: molecular chaperone DnaJ, partial [Firmicutes bacterium]|nr:molecular chaperone DnaJ [Bacillota bacterium]
DGNDIHIEIPLSIVDATLGTTIDVPTVYGDVTVRIPAGTQPGQILKVRGKGVRDLRGNDAGDQFIHLRVETPTKLSKEQRDLLTRYKETETKEDSVWEKFKNTFRS